MTISPKPIQNHDIARARALVLAHGWNSTSFQIVNPGIRRWFSSLAEAVVGYSTAKRTRVVVGAPIVEERDLKLVIDEFELSARRSNENVCYFSAEQRLESALADSPVHSKFLIGAQPVWDPRDWSDIVATNRSLRAQLNRARNKGAVVTEWPASDAHGHPELESLLSDWLNSKGLPPLQFMVQPNTLTRLKDRRIFVAQAADRVIGFLVLSPVACRNGWLIEQFPHRPGSPNGTVELMIDTAMRAMADDGFHYVTLGLSPLSQRAEIERPNEPVMLRVLLAWLRKHAKRFYNFDGLDAFKAKLKPTRWEPVFAVSTERRVSFRTLYAIACVFSGNAPFRLVIGGLRKAVATELRWLRQKISSQ